MRPGDTVTARVGDRQRVLEVVRAIDKRGRSACRRRVPRSITARRPAEGATCSGACPRPVLGAPDEEGPPPDRPAPRALSSGQAPRRRAPDRVLRARGAVAGFALGVTKRAPALVGVFPSPRNGRGTGLEVEVLRMVSHGGDWPECSWSRRGIRLLSRAVA